MVKPSLIFAVVLLVAASAFADAPINQNCPVGNGAIDADIPTIEYKGHTIGFCCAKCDEAFLKWDENRRDAFVAASLAAPVKMKETIEVGDENKVAPADSKKARDDLYTLSTCIVSGGELGAMGDPIVKEYNGREVRFCCERCIKRFEADPEKYLEKANAELIKQQLPYYPLDTCVVGGGELGEMGDPINFVYNNRLVRFCCPMCEKKFKADPETFLNKLDAAVIAKQRDDYPFETCIVGGGDLNSMGEPTELIVGNRLMRFCCGRCQKKVKDNPAKFVALLDKAWAEKHQSDSNEE